MIDEHPYNEWIEFNDKIVMKWLENGTTIIVSAMDEPNKGFWCWAALDEDGNIWDWRPEADGSRVFANRQRAMDSADKHLTVSV